MKEARERYERPRRHVDGNSNPHCRGFGEDQTNRALKLSQACSAEKAKLVRLGNSPAKALASRCARKKANGRSHHLPSLFFRIPFLKKNVRNLFLMSDCPEVV